MSFYEKYDLTRLIGDGDAKTFRAVENATGRAVFVHLFNPTGQVLLGKLRSRFEADGKTAAPVIEIGEFAGSAYAVTEVIEPFTSLPDWAESWTVAAIPTPIVAPPPVLALPPDPAPLAPPASAAQETGAGEFTRNFQAQPSRPAPLPQAEEDEFSKMFQALPVEPAPAPQAPSAPAGGGEFTRMFRTPAPSPPPDAQEASLHPVRAAPAKLAPLPESSSPESGQGEFTRIFQTAPVKAAPTLQQPPIETEQGEFTRLFHSSPVTPAPTPALRDDRGTSSRSFQAPPQVKLAPLPQPSTPQSGEGEFTRSFQAGRANPNPSPQPPPAQQAAPDEFERMMARPIDSPATPKGAPRPFSADDMGQFNPLLGSGLSGEAIDIEEEQAKAARSKAPENRPFQQAGDFTRMFGRREQEGGAAPPPPPPPARPGQASASQLFLSPDELAKLSADVLAKPEAQDEGPGSYTRMFGPRQPGSEEAPTPKPAPPPTPVPVPASKKNPAVLIGIILGAVVLIALMAWFLLSRKR